MDADVEEAELAGPALTPPRAGNARRAGGNGSLPFRIPPPYEGGGASTLWFSPDGIGVGGRSPTGEGGAEADDADEDEFVAAGEGESWGWKC